MFDGLRAHPVEAVVEPTPRELVGKIRRHAALVVADRELQQLRARTQGIKSEIRRLVADNPGGEYDKHAVLDAELAALEPRIRPAYAAVAAERPAFIGKCDDALADTRRAAARRAADAIAELRAAIAILDGCNAAISFAGGEPLHHGHLPLPDLFALEQLMRRRAG